MGKKEEAVKNRSMGCNCSQAVSCAFSEVVDVEETDIKNATKQYGGGAKKVCGAVMALFAIENMRNGKVNLEDPAAWTPETKKKLQELESAFLEKNGSVLCAELKGRETGKPLRSCQGCIEDAAEIYEQYLATHS